MLEPILFLNYRNDLLDVVASEVWLFADDTAIYPTIKDPNDGWVLQNDLDCLSRNPYGTWTSIPLNARWWVWKPPRDLLILYFITRESWWHTIAYPCANAMAYLHAHQNFKCVAPVLIHRAITCENFKVLAQKAYKGLCDNPKKQRTQNPTFLPLVTPDMHTGQNFAPLYSTLHYLWFDMQHELHDYVCTKWILGHFGATPLALPPGITSKLRMCSSSPHP